MANRRWLGRALAVAQVSTITVGGTWASSDTVTLSVNGKDLVLTLGTDTSTDAVATAIKELWNGDTQTGTGDHTFSETGDDVPEFDEVTATVAGSVVTLTADTAGVPFTLASSKNSVSGTVTDATPTAATGPNHWDDADNWEGGAVPVNTDDVYLENSTVPVKYGLNQSGVTLTSLNIAQSFEADVGLPEVNADGAADYHEYRDRYLQIGATTVNLGEGPGQGSGRINLDTGAVQTAVNVFATGQPAEADLEALQWKGTHASNTFHLVGGSAAIAGYGGDAATVATLRVGSAGGGGDVRLRVGAGVTLTTLEMQSGDVEVACATTAVNKSGGTLVLTGTGGHVAVENWAGELAYLSSGTLTTTCVIGPGATIDCSGDLRAKTFTPQVQIHAGGVLFSPHAGVLTLTGGFKPVKCRLSDITVELGHDRAFTVT